MKKEKLKMICNWDQDYDKVVTIEKQKNGDLDMNSWWYLHGELESLCHYDKATVYNLSMFPEYQKETLRWSSITGDQAVISSDKKHTEIYCNGEVEVEVYGIDKPCTGFFWVTNERKVKAYYGGKEIEFSVWDQRGYVCLNDDEEAVKKAKDLMNKKPYRI